MPDDGVELHPLRELTDDDLHAVLVAVHADLAAAGSGDTPDVDPSLRTCARRLLAGGLHAGPTRAPEERPNRGGLARLGHAAQDQRRIECREHLAAVDRGVLLALQHERSQ